MDTRHFIDSIKTISYNKVTMTHVQVVYQRDTKEVPLYIGEVLVNDGNGIKSFYETDGFCLFNNNWIRTSYVDYTQNLDMDLSCSTLLGRIKKNKILEEKSQDAEQETILHYFLRRYEAVPSPDTSRYNEIERKTNIARIESVNAFLTLRDSEPTRLQTFKTNLNNINSNMHADVLKPLLEDKEGLDPTELFDALKVKDANRNTPLHVGASIPIGSGIISRLKVVLNSLSRLDETQRLYLLETRGSDNDTILDCAARNENPQVFEAIQKAFSKEAIEKNICSPQSTFFQHLTSNTSSTIHSILGYLCPTDEMEDHDKDEKKESASFIPQQFLQADSENRNFLHIACRKSRFEHDNSPVNLVSRVCVLLNTEEKPLSLKEKALLKVTSKGWNPLHYACRSGKIENIQSLISHIHALTLYQALSAKTNRGYTPLHYACQYGDKLTLETILNKLEENTPGASYYFLKLHEATLRKRVKENKNNSTFTEGEFDDLLLKYSEKNTALCNLVDTYRYLEQRNKEAWLVPDDFVDSDYFTKKNDFLDQLKQKMNALNKEKTFSSFSANVKFKTSMTCCFFQRFGSQRYYNHMDRLAKTSNDQLTMETWKQFEAFLKLQTENSLNKDILNILATLKPSAAYHSSLLDVAVGPSSSDSAHFNPSAPPISSLRLL